MLKSLRKKFILVTMSIVTGMLIIIFALVYFFTAWNLDTQVNSMLNTVHLSESATGAQPLVPLPYFTIRLTSLGTMSAYGITNQPIEDRDFLGELINEINREGAEEGVLQKYNLQYSVRKSYTAINIAFVDISGHRATLNSLVYISILVSLLGFGVFLFISILLSRWAVRPVADAWQKQKQFVSDASHELKTPLTVILSNAELLQSDDWEQSDKARFSKNILTMSHQMRHLVEGMLELSRADSEQMKKLFAPLNMSGLVSSAVLPFEPVFFEGQQLLETDITPDICLSGSENHLRQLIEILLDNAGKYAQPGVVEVALRKASKGQCLLAVSSPGNPIPQENLQKIFERFYRVDAARERNGSFGLGLSIAKTIVSDHGGKIWAESNETGNCFFVQLPCL